MSKIEKTTDYGIFTFLDCNRDPEKTESHVRELVRAIAKCNKLHVCPIVVDKNFGIIDGQHRLTAAARLGVPIYYIIDEEAEVEDIGMLNSLQKGWRPMDFINHYAARGFPEYVKLKAFLEKHNIIRIGLLLKAFDTNNDSIRKGTYKYFTADQEKDFILVLEKVGEVKKLILDKSFLGSIDKHDILNSDRFTRPLITFLKRDDVNFEEFKSKFELLIERFRKCVNCQAYYNLFIDIYNYRRQARIE